MESNSAFGVQYHVKSDEFLAACGRDPFHIHPDLHGCVEILRCLKQGRGEH